MDALTALPHTPEDRAYRTRSIERITSGFLTQINSGMAQRPEAEFIIDPDSPRATTNSPEIFWPQFSWSRLLFLLN